VSDVAWLPVSELVAWTPVVKGNAPLIFSVLLHPRQALSISTFMALLAERIQTMVVACDDPEFEAAEFQRSLEEGGLWSGPMTVLVEEAGNILVYSNPNVVSRLYAHGFPENVDHLEPTEMPEARSEIVADQEDPSGRLVSWVSAISVLP
jgi:hypothetical protein